MKGILFALIILLVTAYGMARTDQEWLTLGAKGRIGESDVLLIVDQEIQFDASRLVNEESLLLLGYGIGPYFSTHLGHRVVREREAKSGHFATEHRPTLDLCAAVPEFYTLKLDFRSRFECRDKAGSRPYMRYRERVRLRTSWGVTAFRLSPYASEELFFSDRPGVSSSDAFDRTRSQVGISFCLVPEYPDFSCAIYFMVQHAICDGARTWSPLDIFGFAANYTF